MKNTQINLIQLLNVQPCGLKSTNSKFDVKLSGIRLTLEIPWTSGRTRKIVQWTEGGESERVWRGPWCVCEQVCRHALRNPLQVGAPCGPGNSLLFPTLIGWTFSESLKPIADTYTTASPPPGPYYGIRVSLRHSRGIINIIVLQVSSETNRPNACG